MSSPKNSEIRIALDAMGGDFAPRNEVQGAVLALRELPDKLRIILVGDENKIAEELKKAEYSGDKIQIRHAAEVITMHDSPSKAVKEKKDSSLVVAANLVKNDEADALVSAGNTGAVGVASIFIIGRIKGVSRPTIAAPIPNEKRSFTYISDAGAFVDSKPDHLVEFATLTATYLSEVYGVKNPSVGLLNVGEEESKGLKFTKETFDLMKKTDLNFIGNIEGRDIFKGTVDIALCDGFIGNLLLKQAESMLSFLKTKFKQYAETSLIAKLQIGLAVPAIKKALYDADVDNVGGTPLLGINGITIIGHGSSKPKGIKNMILQAAKAFDADLVNKLKEAIENEHERTQSS
jgi:glycerol-3-phosphate acyltransferase PlsX